MIFVFFMVFAYLGEREWSLGYKSQGAIGQRPRLQQVAGAAIDPEVAAQHPGGIVPGKKRGQLGNFL